MTVLLDTAGRGVLSECPTSAVNPADGHQPDARSRSDQLQATSGYDRQGNASESASSESYSTRQLWLFRHPRLYESLREFRSLVRRRRPLSPLARSGTIRCRSTSRSASARGCGWWALIPGQRTSPTPRSLTSTPTPVSRIRTAREAASIARAGAVTKRAKWNTRPLGSTRSAGRGAQPRPRRFRRLSRVLRAMPSTPTICPLLSRRGDTLTKALRGSPVLVRISTS